MVYVSFVVCFHSQHSLHFWSLEESVPSLQLSVILTWSPDTLVSSIRDVLARAYLLLFDTQSLKC